MISIIVCSRTNGLSELLKNNIKETIGCDYELVVIDNSKNKLSIFQAYNQGISKSKKGLLCFIHDDIFIKTPNWGIILKEIFNKKLSIGVLGIAGSKTKTLTPSSWSLHERSINIIQHYKFENKKADLISIGFNSDIEEVVTLDGVFMVFNSEKNLRFNEDFRGFHFYDMNICMEAKRKGLKNFVTNQITIEHFSEGYQSTDWVRNGILMHKFYRRHLPIFINKKIKQKEIEKLALRNLIQKSIDLKIPRTVFPYFFNLLLNHRRNSRRLIFNYIMSFLSLNK